KRSPSAVNVAGYVLRSTRLTPSHCSNFCIRRLKAGCVTQRISAAREKFRVLVKTRKSSSQTISTTRTPSPPMSECDSVSSTPWEVRGCLVKMKPHTAPLPRTVDDTVRVRERAHALPQCTSADHEVDPCSKRLSHE